MLGYFPGEGGGPDGCISDAREGVVQQVRTATAIQLGGNFRTIGDPVSQVIFGRHYRNGPAFAAKLRGGSPSQCRRHIS